MKNNILVFYCNWGVVEKGGVYYISNIHNIYIEEARKRYQKVILISKEKKELTPSDIKINNNIEVYKLPNFNSYLDSIYHFKTISSTLKMIIRKYDKADYYIRTPEPYSWLFNIYKESTFTKLKYHFVSNPLEAILNKINDNKFKRYIKYFIYYPEFLLTCYAAKKNIVSSNGVGLFENLNRFLPKKTIILNESTINKSDIIEYKKKNINKYNINLLYVGYLRPAKGLIYLVTALSELKKNNRNHKFTLNLVGDGDYKYELILAIKKLDLENDVIFHGHIEDKEKLNYLYASNDLFVFPSLSEGSPRVILEAMANGLPVIASNVGNIKHLLKNNRGVCIPPKDSNSIQNAITYCIKNELVVNDFINNSLSFVHENTIDIFFDSFKDM